ncbi:MAG: alkaline phosphatase family protein, partial [Terriglobales bacterium]
YKLHGVTSRAATDAPPFWRCTKDTGLKCLIIDAPEFDVYDDVPGLQVANWGTHKSERLGGDFVTRPASLQTELAQKFKEPEWLATYVARPTEEKDSADLQTGLQRIRDKAALCRELIERDRFDLIVIGLFEMHTLGHRLWSYLPQFQQQPSGLSDALGDLYAELDKALGELLVLLPADSNVFVLSPYGLDQLYPMQNLTEAFMHQLGYQVDLPARSQLADPIQALRKFVPERFREKISRGLSPAVQEQLISHRLEMSTDWSRTRAFSIPNVYTSLIRINLKGREPQGTVDSGDYERVVDELECDFLLLTHPDGTPAVRNIIKTCEVYSCSPDHDLPDLFVEWEWNKEFAHIVH